MNPNSLKLSRKYIKRRTILRCYQNGEKLLRQKVAKNVFPENLIFSIIFDEAKNYFFWYIFCYRLTQELFTFLKPAQNYGFFYL